MHPADEHAGRRIADLRKINGMTQVALADATSFSVSLIAQVETGKKPASAAFVAACARALHVDIGVISGQPYQAELRADHLEQLIDPIREGLDWYDIGPADPQIRPRETAVLVAIVDDMCAKVRAGQLRAVAELLPSIMEEATAAAYTEGTSEAWGVLGTVYRNAYDVSTKLGYQDLAAISLDRMDWAGQRASDPVLSALRQYMRALVHLRSGKYAMGGRLIQAGQRILEQAPDGTERTAMSGQLHLGASVIAARNGDHDTATDHLDQAHLAASRTGEVPKLRWVSFGPTNVAAHRVAALAELKDYNGAVRAAQTMTIPADWPASRTGRHLVEVANAELWTGRTDAAFKSLLRARKVAPQQTRYDFTVRETVAALVRAQRSTPDTLSNLAQWVGI
ncbi:MAG: helix-turn-helix domain-containing protein [Streptomyces sp.]|nr:helix-turn-helix domain-containing protein [Streptomyces sp.]NUS15410.1 helix-turn-helix domain-containing protein [Streptomyces sp.]NUS24008.1 helix-turn-helix domain-containing protein [Streptomyces sp.]